MFIYFARCCCDWLRASDWFANWNWNWNREVSAASATAATLDDLVHCSSMLATNPLLHIAGNELEQLPQ